MSMVSLYILLALPLRLDAFLAPQWPAAEAAIQNAIKQVAAILSATGVPQIAA